MFKNLKRKIKTKFQERLDSQKVLLAKSLEKNNNIINQVKTLKDLEFKCFSQFGDDGIISWITNKFTSEYFIDNFTFYEMACGNLDESNSKYQILSNNYSSKVFDIDKNSISEIKNSYIYQKYNIQATAVKITKDNVFGLIDKEDKNVIFNLDIDGNDYWILESINFDKFKPLMFVCEYNNVFGYEKLATIKYDEDFNRFNFSDSGCIYGASISLLISFFKKKNYLFVGTNSASNNAYFIQNDFADYFNKAIQSKIIHSQKFSEILNKINFSKDKKINEEYIKNDLARVKNQILYL